MSKVKFFNPREIKDWTEGEMKLLIIVLFLNCFGLLFIMAILLESIFWWLVWFNFGILISAFPYLYWNKRRAWNKLKSRKDGINKIVVDWNRKYFKNKSAEMMVGRYASWLELSQIEESFIQVSDGDSKDYD